MSAAQQQQMVTREEYQKKLEELYDKHQLMPRVRKYFQERTDIPFKLAMQSAGIDEDFGFDMLAQIAVHKRADVSTLVGCLRRHCDTDQEVANSLEIAVKKNFLMFNQGIFIVQYDIPLELQQELDRFQYPLPMVCEPALVEDNLDTGYLTQRGSIILKNNHHAGDVCLDHINRMNRIQLSINERVARTIQNKWKHLDKKKDDESFDDWKKRRKAFEKYQSVAEGIIALLVRAGNVLRLTHAYDKRGRTYCRGFHITYQGTDWNKAVLELANREVIEE
jgi:hypothetical protein